MTKRYKITDIDWDTDGEEVDLPAVVVVEKDIGRDDVVDDILADYLSDTYGFCTYGFSFDEVEEPDPDGILDRIAASVDGCFGSIDNAPGTLYIDEGGNTYAVTVRVCDPVEEYC